MPACIAAANDADQTDHIGHAYRASFATSDNKEVNCQSLPFWLNAVRNRERIGGALVRAFFVRVAADRQVVGLFVAPSIMMLATLVDECCDPDSCEYAPAGMGGMLVERPTRATWPLSDPAKNNCDGTYEFATGLEDAALTQHWVDDLRLAPIRLEWKPLTSPMPSILRAVDLKSVEASEGNSDPYEKT